jgi:hypothetical protein
MFRPNEHIARTLTSLKSSAVSYSCRCRSVSRRDMTLAKSQTPTTGQVPPFLTIQFLNRGSCVEVHAFEVDLPSTPRSKVDREVRPRGQRSTPGSVESRPRGRRSKVNPEVEGQRSTPRSKVDTGVKSRSTRGQKSTPRSMDDPEVKVNPEGKGRHRGQIRVDPEVKGRPLGQRSMKTKKLVSPQATHHQNLKRLCCAKPGREHECHDGLCDDCQQRPTAAATARGMLQCLASLPDIATDMKPLVFVGFRRRREEGGIAGPSPRRRSVISMKQAQLQPIVMVELSRPKNLLT